MIGKTSLPVTVAAALLAAAAAGHGAQAQRGRGGGVQLPQVACASGAPAATAQARAAQDALNRTLLPRISDADKQRFYTTALEQANAGIAASADNPYHHFFAGQAHAGLGHLTEAAAAWAKTLELCPQFADEVAASRRQAADAAFNTGIVKYQAGDTAAAIAGWESVAMLDSTRTEAFFNLGVVYGQKEDLAHAATAYRRVLATVPAADDTAGAERRTTSMAALLGIGASLFQQNKFNEAHDIFTTLRALDPSNRDALYNDALSLYKTSRWAEAVPVASRLAEIDPLNYNVRIVLFNAYKGISEAAHARRDTAVERVNRNNALHTLEAADGMPVQISDVQLSGVPGSVTIKGVATGGKAATGAPQRIEFTLTNTQGPVGTGTATFPAPAKDAKANFEVTIPVTGPVTSWRYRTLP